MMEEKYLKHFDESITEEIEHFAYETVLSQSRYIFVKKENGQYMGYCSNCGEEFSLYTAKHKDIEMCPACKCSGQIRMIRYGRRYLKDAACFIRYDKSKIDNETLVARAFLVERDYSGDYKNVNSKFQELARYIFSPTESIMFEKERWWCSDRQFYYKTTVHGYNRDSLHKLNNFIDWKSLEQATKDNRFKYSMYKSMGYRDQYAGMTKYFAFYNKYPIIERLIKIGFKDLVKRKLEGISLENCVNWKQKDDVFKFLKLNRAEVREIASSKVKITPAFLKIYRQNKELKWKFTCNQLKELEDLMSYTWYETHVKQYTTWNKIFKYISKQLEKYKMWESKKDVLRTWIDYMRDCKTLDFDINDKNLMFPKDLYTQHQNFIAQIKYKEDMKLKEGFEKQKKRREQYRFEYNGIIFIPANSQNELIEEGKALYHCVGGYAESCSSGKTDIIFIRKECEPNKSFVTMEVTKNKVVQVRAAHNKKPPEDVLDAVEQFKIQVLSKLSKKKSKRKKKVA